MKNSDFIGIKRRKIEDQIVLNFEKVNFNQKKRAWLEDKVFWDYIFSWYDLAKYYDESSDTAIGAHMLELYMHCVNLFREAAQDGSINERRRDKAADALYQINYYVNQIMVYVHRNSHEDGGDQPTGAINWK